VISVGLVPLVLNLQRLPATDHSQLGQQREGIKDILLLGIHNKSCHPTTSISMTFYTQVSVKGCYTVAESGGLFSPNFAIQDTTVKNKA
jgi:hypothetical protein